MTIFDTTPQTPAVPNGSPTTPDAAFGALGTGSTGDASWPPDAFDGALGRRDAPIWEGSLDGPLTCVRVHDVTPDIRSFVFASPGRRFEFDPGQYVTVALPQLPGVSRCYTITSAPTRPDTIAITVKRLPGGEFSPVLHEVVRPGTVLEVDGPFGDFSVRHHPAPAYLFISAGSGITPLLSMLRTLHDLGRGAHVAFVHFARTPLDVPFREELAAIAAAEAGVNLTFVVEDDGGPGQGGTWHGLRGRISAGLLGAAVPDAALREAFVCGPRPFMEATRAALHELGLPEPRYHEESFVLADHAAATALLPAGPPSDTSTAADAICGPDGLGSDGFGAGEVSEAERVIAYAVQFSRSGAQFTCRSDQSVLEAAWAAGLNPPASCTQGLCGTCKVSVVEGTVDMEHQGGIRPREIAAGQALICCSKPTSDLVIEA